jgi:hypothetical protein
MRADQFNELFRQQRPCKVSSGGYPLQPNVCVFNFELPGQKIISLEPHMKLESIVIEGFFYQNMYCRRCR